MSAPQGYYVYAHRSADAAIFYIGMGKDRRAWATSGRHSVWHHYVGTHLRGRYTVEILREGLCESDALDLEGALIAELGERLVNWVNPGRKFDYEALDKYWALRRSCQTILRRARSLEATDPESALNQYREAMRIDDQARAIDTNERGLVGDLCREMDQASSGQLKNGCIEALDRITLLLRRLGRFEEIVQTVDGYFELHTFPVTDNHPARKRREEARAILAGERKPRSIREKREI